MIPKLKPVGLGRSPAACRSSPTRARSSTWTTRTGRCPPADPARRGQPDPGRAGRRRGCRLPGRDRTTSPGRSRRSTACGCWRTRTGRPGYRGGAEAALQQPRLLPDLRRPPHGRPGHPGAAARQPRPPARRRRPSARTSCRTWPASASAGSRWSTATGSTRATSPASSSTGPGTSAARRSTGRPSGSPSSTRRSRSTPSRPNWPAPPTSPTCSGRYGPTRSPPAPTLRGRWICGSTRPASGPGCRSAAPACSSPRRSSGPYGPASRPAWPATSAKAARSGSWPGTGPPGRSRCGCAADEPGHAARSRPQLGSCVASELVRFLTGYAPPRSTNGCAVIDLAADCSPRVQGGQPEPPLPGVLRHAGGRRSRRAAGARSAQEGGAMKIQVRKVEQTRATIVCG